MNFKFIAILICAILITILGSYLNGTLINKSNIPNVDLNRENLKHVFSTEYANELQELSKSAEIKSFLDRNIEPCQDFYAYACGNWKKIYPATVFNNVANTDRFGDIPKGIERKLYKILQRKKTENASIEDKIIDFYQSCQNIKSDGIQYRLALEKVLQEFGKFSFLKSEEELEKSNEFQWWSTIAKIQNIYGKSIILSVDILDDIKNKSRTMLYLGTPNFDMTQSGMKDLQESKIKRYLKLYFDIDSQEALILATEIMEFEKYLSRGATDAQKGYSIEQMTVLYNTTDLKDNYIDLVDMEQFLEIVLETKQLPKQVYVYDEPYLDNLFEVFNATDVRIVENYILWLLLEEYIMDYSDKDLDETCLEKTKKYFGKFIDHSIYNQYRSKEAESEIFELWDDIRSQFRFNINHNYAWMSNATKEYAIKKLNYMNLTINSYDNEDFEKIFENLNIDSSNYILNIQTILKSTEALRENKLEKKPDGIDDAAVISYTPVYNLFENKIKLPIALLQPHFIWHPNYPKAIKYGTLGFLIAHEMIHGFDFEGIGYDVHGNAHKWFDEVSLSKFKSNQECFQKQYHNYIFGEKNLPNSTLQSENLADNAAVKLAYAAYVGWLQRQKITKKTKVEASDTLLRLEFNNRELFFISFAQVWCEDTHPALKSSFANSDTHAPSKFRVIGSLTNFDEFSWIWKCKENDPMRSTDKCEIYKNTL